MDATVRQLAAIMAIDVVGFSRLMEAREARTLEALRALLDVTIAPLVAQHRGRVVELMGDGVLAVFASVVDAVNCASAIQERPATAPPAIGEPSLALRIGVHLGDIVIEGADIMGDGVNLAARLEQLCPAGGVLISGEAFDHLQGKTDLRPRFVGKRRLKNIHRPIRVYLLEPKAKRLKLKRQHGSPARIAAATLFALVLAGAAY